MLKKFLILLITVFMCCSCTKKSNTEEITFSSWGSVTETQIINALITKYEKQNPNVKIRFMHIPQNYFQKIHLLFASSTAPDVIFINNLYLPVYAGKLEPLDDVIDKKDFYEKGLEPLSYNGNLYAVPRDLSCFLFFYNKNLTGEISQDWSFEDFKKLLKKNKDFWSVSYERDIFKAEPYTLTLGFDEGIKFYKSLEGLYAPTPAEVGSSTLAQMFIDGKIGLYLSGRWMLPKIKESADFPFGVVSFPGKVYADASGWAISKESKHKVAAKKFIKYLSSKESIDYFTDTGLVVPARKDSARKIEEAAFIKSIEKSVPRNPQKDYNKQRDLINKKFFN